MSTQIKEAADLSNGTNRTPDISEYPEQVQEFIRGLIPMSEEAFEDDFGGEFLNYWNYEDYLEAGAPLLDAFAAVVEYGCKRGFYSSFRKLIPLEQEGYIHSFVAWLFAPNDDPCPINEDDRKCYAEELLTRLFDISDWRCI